MNPSWFFLNTSYFEMDLLVNERTRNPWKGHMKSISGRRNANFFKLQKT